MEGDSVRGQGASATVEEIVALARAGEAVVVEHDWTKPIVTRLFMAAVAGVAVEQIETAQLSREEWERLTTACEELARLPIYLGPGPGQVAYRRTAEIDATHVRLRDDGP